MVLFWEGRYNVAKIRVKPIQAARAVCPSPHSNAYNGDIGKLEARYTNAIVALLTTPDVNGGTTPMIMINIGKNLPNLCLRNVANAIKAAICK